MKKKIKEKNNLSSYLKMAKLFKKNSSWQTLALQE